MKNFVMYGKIDELKFLEGEDQAQDSFEVRFCGLPDFDGGEDIFEEEEFFDYVLKAAQVMNFKKIGFRNIFSGIV